MKHIMVVAALLCGSLHAPAQTNNTKSTGTAKTGQVKKRTAKKSMVVQHKQSAVGTSMSGGKVVALHHGSHDYTPGSPIGTGGAGGSTMSGSPQGSASENALGKKPSNTLLKKKNG